MIGQKGRRDAVYRPSDGVEARQGHGGDGHSDGVGQSAATLSSSKFLSR